MNAKLTWVVGEGTKPTTRQVAYSIYSLQSGWTLQWVGRRK